MTGVVTPGLAVTYILSTGEHTPATIMLRFWGGCTLCRPQRAMGHGPKPEAKPAPKLVPKGKHVQLFKMRRKVRKGFYSIAPDAPNGQ